MAEAVQQIAAGDYAARTNIRGEDELGELGQAFDQLLQDKVATLAEAQQENETLNASIIQLLQAVFQLSQRIDLIHKLRKLTSRKKISDL